jgi:hypothetical protein
MSFETYFSGNREELEYYSTEKSFSSHTRFLEDFKLMLREEYMSIAACYRNYFEQKKIKKRLEYTSAMFGDEETYKAEDFLAEFEIENDDEVTNFHATAAYFGCIIDKAIQGTFRRFPKFPCTLPLQDEESQPHASLSRKESLTQSQHQSDQHNLDTTSTLNTNDDQEMEIEEPTSSTSRGNRNARQRRFRKKLPRHQDHVSNHHQNQSRNVIKNNDLVPEKLRY